MSSAKPVKKKIVVTKQQPTSTSSRKSSGSRMTNDEPMEMLFKRKNLSTYNVNCNKSKQ